VTVRTLGIRKTATVLGLAALGLTTVTAYGASGHPTQAGAVPHPPRAAMGPMSMPATAVAPAPASQTAAGTTAVAVKNFTFAPATLTVKAGTTVTWTNNDGEPHNIVATDGTFRSATLDTGGTFQHTFTKPGSYTYLCSIHPFMRATVVVTP